MAADFRMGLFDRLFRKAERPASRLDDFLSAIDRSSIPARAREHKRRNLQLATAISLLALEQSGRFVRELFGRLREAPFAPTTDRSASSFDAAVFETAAFSHYSLLAKHLGSPGDHQKDGDTFYDDDSAGGSYFVAVRDAHYLTGTLLDSMASFRANKEAFLNRPIAYSMGATRRQAIVEMFEGILIEAIESGAPATLRATGANDRLGLHMAVAIAARNFAVTT